MNKDKDVVKNKKKDTANRIKEIREEQHKTQKEVGKAVGVSDRAIAHYENGIREPKVAMWKKLASFFNVTTAYLMGLSNDRDGWKTVEEYTGMSKQDITSGKLDKRTAERMNDDIFRLGSASEINDYISLLLAIDTSLASNESISENDKKFAHKLLDNLLNNNSSSHSGD